MRINSIAAFFLCGCTSISQGVKLAEFTYNDKPRNSWIVDRIPEYGNGRKDGCIVEGQILLTLKTMNDSTFIGQVQDVETLDPLAGALIRIYSAKSEQLLAVAADQKGKFAFSSMVDIKKIDVNYIGFKTLDINFKKRLN